MPAPILTSAAKIMCAHVDLLVAVGYAGRNGIVHRDLEHENALITNDGHDRFPDASNAWEAPFEEAVLEFIGPSWRRDATLERTTVTAIDRSDIPAQTATPLRPGKPSPSADPIVATTGSQTYRAPAALHEVLGTDEPAAPTATPPPHRPRDRGRATSRDRHRPR